MSTFVLHPEAHYDLTEIWEYIATDNLDTADRVIDEIYETITSLVRFLPVRVDCGGRAESTGRDTESEKLPPVARLLAYFAAVGTLTFLFTEIPRNSHLAAKPDDKDRQPAHWKALIVF